MSAERQAAQRRVRFVAGLRRDSAVTDDAVAEAFARVPREAFMVDGFRTMEGRWITAAEADFLAEVYRNEALVTKLRNGVPVSSSSQPSLMAAMLEALDVRPGFRVLEIGAGTGYNAALLAALGAEVTSVDVQPDVAHRAGAALRRAGTAGVTLVTGDGYAGHPPRAPYHRVVVTAGINGLSPAWLDQLTEDGSVLAPVFHAGVHPVLRIHPERDGTATGRGVVPAGFMIAAGPLSAGYPWRHPEPLRSPLPAPAVHGPARWRPPLDGPRYRDLAIAAGAWHRRITHGAVADEPDVDWVLLDRRGTAGAGVRPDGAVVGCGPHGVECAQEATELLDRWEREGRPAVTDWRVTFTPTGHPDHPILAPHHWTR